MQEKNTTKYTTPGYRCGAIAFDRNLDLGLCLISKKEVK